MVFISEDDVSVMTPDRPVHSGHECLRCARDELMFTVVFRETLKQFHVTDTTGVTRTAAGRTNMSMIAYHTCHFFR